MALESVMDAIAVRLAANLSSASSSGTKGLLAAYSAASTTQGASIIPRSVDDWPVAIVWFGGTDDASIGNGPEREVWTIEVQFWCNAQDAAFAYQTLIPFVSRCKVLFRTDMNANDTAARVLYRGASPAEVDDAHGKPFLVLTVYLEVLDLDPTNSHAM